MTYRVPVEEVVAGVVDPELPLLTIVDLGVVRDVAADGDAVTVTITPTYSGCPAIDEIRTQLRNRLLAAGYGPVEVRTVLAPAWSTDWISPAGRRALAEHGIAPPDRAERQPVGQVLLRLSRPHSIVSCPRCGSASTTELSQFGPTACTALRRCGACREPFEHMKEI